MTVVVAVIVAVREPDGVLLEDKEADTVTVVVVVKVADGVVDPVPVADGEADVVPLRDADGVNDAVIVMLVVPVPVADDVGEDAGVKVALGVFDTDMAGLPLGALVAVLDPDGVLDTVAEKEWEEVILGGGVELGLAGVFTCVTPPVPSCPILLSPQQEMMPPIVSTHVK